MKRQKILIVFSVLAVTMLLSSYILLTGCRAARLKRLKEIREAETAEENIDQGNQEIKEVIDLSEEIDEEAEIDESADIIETEKTIGGDVTSDENTLEEEGVLEGSQEGQYEENEESQELQQDASVEDEAEQQALPEQESEEEVVQQVVVIKNIDDEGGTLKNIPAFVSPGIGAGDFSSGEEIRGYISFDITQLLGSDIYDVKLQAIGEKRGDPFSHYGPLIVKAVYWGPYKINPTIFDLEGVELANVSVKNWTIGNSILKNDLQKAIDNGLERYQICIYFEIQQTDGNNTDDNLWYKLYGITLNVTYAN